MRFADIPGHEEVKQKLRRLADSDRIPHALLLEGPSGTAKFALARAFAQYVHCTSRTGGDSCGRCPSCRQHETFNHADTLFSFPVVKKGSGPTRSDDYLPEFREFISDSPWMDFERWLSMLDNINAQPNIYVDEANALISRLNFTATCSKYKIVLMWLPERLKEEAANKILKLVEEPYPDTLFVLTSDASRLILPTIYSRTQRIGVSRYSDEEIAAYLGEKCSLDMQKASYIARLAGGSIAEAVRLISLNKDSELFLSLFMSLMRTAYGRKVADLKKWAYDLAALGRERMMKFYDYCARMIRENFILNLHIDDLTYLNDAERQFSSRFAPFINERNVLKLFDVVNDAKADIAANANAKLVNFDVAIKIILLLK